MAARSSRISCLLAAASHTHSAPVIRDEYSGEPPEWERTALDKIRGDAYILDVREARRALIGPSEQASDEQTGSEMIVTLAGAGRHVVRLVGADEASLARIEHEIAACRAAGITVEIVPHVIPPPEGEGGDARERGRSRVGG